MPILLIYAYLSTWIRILFAVTQVWPAFRNFAPIRPVLQNPWALHQNILSWSRISSQWSHNYTSISQIKLFLDYYHNIFRVWIWWLILSKLFLPATALSKSADWRTWKKDVFEVLFLEKLLIYNHCKSYQNCKSLQSFHIIFISPFITAISRGELHLIQLFLLLEISYLLNTGRG